MRLTGRPPSRPRTDGLAVLGAEQPRFRGGSAPGTVGLMPVQPWPRATVAPRSAVRLLGLVVLWAWPGGLGTSALRATRFARALPTLSVLGAFSPLRAPRNAPGSKGAALGVRRAGRGGRRPR